MNYPTNGNGYNNHIYGLFFGTKTAMGVLPEDSTRECISLIESLPEAEEVKAWLDLAKTEENKAMVQKWSDTVKTTRSYYNNAVGNKEQSQFITAELSEKLLAVETELRAVKKAFGIAIKLAELRVASTSTHKTEYMAGETFDMTGLVIELVYDDYSTEIANPAQVTLKTTTELSRLTRYVEVSYSGKTLRILVTVKEVESSDEETSEEPEENLPADTEETDYGWLIGVGIAAGVVLCAAAGAYFFLLKGKKKAPVEKPQDGCGEETSDLCEMEEDISQDTSEDCGNETLNSCEAEENTLQNTEVDGGEEPQA
jgi:hypothetical protein